jgi:uncharacterized protein
MFSLQAFFGKGDRFFDLLEASAEEARSSVQALIRTVKSPEQATSLDDFILARRKEKRITEQISEELVATFVTGLEREDIEALSIALYKIPKTVEKFAERFLFCARMLQGAEFAKQAALLERATDTLLAMVKRLRKQPSLDEMKTLNDQLQVTEGDADKLMLDLLRDMYSGKYEALKVVILKDLYELLEKVVDRCRDAGNVVFHIVLKNS